MGTTTKIEWCHHTFNPWVGCTKVSAGCANCYAEALMDKRWGKVKWGPQGTRQRTSESNWREPFKWDKAAAKAGERRRVFCASLADVFEDRSELMPWRRELFDMICRTLNLDWLLLTKRPENALRMMVEAGLYAVENPNLPCPQPNLWIGTSVEDQANADERIPQLLLVPAVVRFLSAEPLLGPIDLEAQKFLSFSEPCYRSFRERHKGSTLAERDAVYADEVIAQCPSYYDGCNCPGIGWVIVGGESGKDARPCDVRWVRSIAEQCKLSDVACFVKQLGSNAEDWSSGRQGGPFIGNLIKDSKGGDPDEWPADLRVREFPVPSARVTA